MCERKRVSLQTMSIFGRNVTLISNKESAEIPLYFFKYYTVKDIKFILQLL